MTGRLILSLDFELMWGVRDHRDIAGYGDAILGGRAAIPVMLDRFKRYGVKATWATVGLLFARNRDEMRQFTPTNHPEYGDPRLSPYPDLDGIVGTDEDDDPYHFGHSLLDRIAQTDGQEIATHTFGHVYALEPGMTDRAWRDDLMSAQAIAHHAGHHLRSIVFPRNQFGASHIRICRELGLRAYRGNPIGAVYRPRSGQELSLPVRAARFVDGAIPLLGSQGRRRAILVDGSIDIPASRFLRPWNPRFPTYSKLHQRRILQEMEQAARSGKYYHLWWHPHNMGRNTAQNMAQLDRILEAFQDLRDRYGFESATMAEIAQQEGIE